MPRPLRLGLILFPFIVSLAVGGWFLYRKDESRPEQQQGFQGDSTADASDASKGKLVVLVVFDQMRGDYISRWSEQFGADGFERIKRKGIWYSNVHLPCRSLGNDKGLPPSTSKFIFGIVLPSMLIKTSLLRGRGISGFPASLTCVAD